MSKFLQVIQGVVILSLVLGGFAIPAQATDKVAYVETYKDKLSCSKEDGETFCDETFIGTFSVVTTIDLGEDVSALLTTDTTVSAEIGNFSTEHSFAEDENYTSGDRKVAFSIDEDEDGVIDATVKIQASTSGLVKIAIKGTIDTLEGVLALSLVEDGEDGKESIEESIAAVFTINETNLGGEASVSFDIDVTGSQVQKTVTKSEEEFILQSIKLKGKATSSDE